jgi:AraC family transcriptional activator of pyochelin receptor
MATVISSADIVNLDILPRPRLAAGNSTSETPDPDACYFHPNLGTIKMGHFFTPYMNVTDILWDTFNDIQLLNCDTPDSVNINFFLQGRIDTRFSGISHELNMRPGQHNIAFSPEGKDKSVIARNQSMHMFHVSLNKDFFISCIGNDDPWSERMLVELYHNRPVSGANRNKESTPQMTRLINSVRNCSVSGPMRNLLIQSRLLELLALQMDQFRTPMPIHEEIRRDEAEKLQQLKTYLESNFLNELSLAQLSRIALLNEFKVKKGFKLLFGTTVFNYVRKLRMDHAQHLLLDGGRTVEEVAHVLGYEHPQHFSIAFKKFTGSTPSSLQHKIKSF